MFTPERWLASLVYAVSLFGTLASVLYLKLQFVTLLCVVVQFSALTWYLLSYVPYGQQCLKSLLKRLAK